ncbi:MAG: helix-turn-helix domain-containing protein [Sarcina sp.]
MNFLSTGEKIKRARIYKGVTLKELCKNDISISKMSCIENDKVKADTWVLEMVAKRLDLNLEYLLHNDVMELEASIEAYKERALIEKDFEDIKERLDYCLAKNYNELSFSFIHLLFKAYTERKKFEEIKEIINIYNEIQSEIDEKQIYFEDLGFYFLSRRNYSDSLTYFNMAINEIVKKGMEENITDYINNTIWFAFSHYNMKNYETSRDILTSLLSLNLKVEDKYIAMVNGLLVANNMKLKEDYEKEVKVFNSFDIKGSVYHSAIALTIFDNYFEVEKINEAIVILEKTRENIKDSEEFEYVQILLAIIGRLIKSDNIDKAREYCEEALELSIRLDSHFYIERSYLYKAKIHRLQKSLIQWEMNMNLATDMLIRFASIEEKKERYMEMAEMYHVIGETRETLKYLTLAMSLDKSEDI